MGGIVLSICFEIPPIVLSNYSYLKCKDNSILARIEDIVKLSSQKLSEIINVLDAYLRDYKTGNTYAR